MAAPPPVFDSRREFHLLVDELSRWLRTCEHLDMVALSSEHAEEIVTIIRGMGEITQPRNEPSLLPTPLEGLRSELGDCQRCKLSASRTRIVFGEGDPHAALMCIGEAPGREEDLAGRPFVGEAGQLLTKILQAINLPRDAVYIANVIKCRPPGNRDPEPEEVEACFPFLEKQIEVIKPRVICALGRYAAQSLLKTKERIFALRGRIHEFHQIKVVPTLHPASLLRNPQWKRSVWEDMQIVQKELEGST
jgi:uracil-DNA glycosylase